MPVLTRRASLPSSNKPYLTPHTPPSTHPRALLEMTPLPSLFDKMVEAAKHNKRSTSVHLESKVAGDLFTLSPICEEPEEPSSDPVHNVRQPSEAPTEVDPAEVRNDPEPVVLQPSATSDHMDFETTPVVFSEQADHTPPPAPFVPPAPPPAFPLVHGEVRTNFLPPTPPYIHPGPPVAPAPTNREGLHLSELANSATFPHPTTYYNPPSTSANFSSHPPSQEQPPFQQPQVNEEPPLIQVPEHHAVFPQYPVFPLPEYPTTLPTLSASEPAQSTMQPAVLPFLTQSLPNFAPVPTYNDTNSQRGEVNWTQLPPPSTPTENSHYRPIFAPQVRQRPGFEEDFAWWLRAYNRPSSNRPYSWRVEETERQREMYQAVEPHIARLREVSRQKRVMAEARVFAGQQKAKLAKEEGGKPFRDSSRGDEKKKAQKQLKEIERQERSEARRQARKDSRDERRRRDSTGNTQPEGQEVEVPVSPRRKSPRRSKPYSIPHPATRSPRRSPVMPGGFDLDDLTSARTSVTTDAFWNGLQSAVYLGIRLWTQI